VLLAFPFADTTGIKRRPALVLLDSGDDDIVVARITSQISQTSYEVQIIRWQEAGLILLSVVRLHKIATVEKQLVNRRLGALRLDDWAKVQERAQRFWVSILG
jgi:mRNA interferase MazF